MHAISRANIICEPLRAMLLKNEEYGGMITTGLFHLLPWINKQYDRCLNLSFERASVLPIGAFIDVYGRNLSSPALLVLCSLLPSHGNSVWSFPQELVVVNTLMEAATALGYIPKAEEEEELEDDASQFKSPFKDATKHPRERPAGYLKTRAKFKQEVLQLIGGKCKELSSQKSSRKRNTQGRSYKIGTKRCVATVSLSPRRSSCAQCKGSSPCVESAFALRGQVLTPARSSMHTELTDVVTQRKYLHQCSVFR